VAGAGLPPIQRTSVPIGMAGAAAVDPLYAELAEVLGNGRACPVCNLPGCTSSSDPCCKDLPGLLQTPGHGEPQSTVHCHCVIRAINS